MAVTRGDDGHQGPGDRGGDRVSAVCCSQGTLFDEDEIPGQAAKPSKADVDSGEIGYRGPTACAAAAMPTPASAQAVLSAGRRPSPDHRLVRAQGRPSLMASSARFVGRIARGACPN